MTAISGKVRFIAANSVNPLARRLGNWTAGFSFECPGTYFLEYRNSTLNGDRSMEKVPLDPQHFMYTGSVHTNGCRVEIVVAEITDDMQFVVNHFIIDVRGNRVPVMPWSGWNIPNGRYCEGSYYYPDPHRQGWVPNQARIANFVSDGKTMIMIPLDAPQKKPEPLHPMLHNYEKYVFFGWSEEPGVDLRFLLERRGVKTIPDDLEIIATDLLIVGDEFWAIGHGPDHWSLSEMINRKPGSHVIYRRLKQHHLEEEQRLCGHVTTTTTAEPDPDDTRRRLEPEYLIGGWYKHETPSWKAACLRLSNTGTEGLWLTFPEKWPIGSDGVIRSAMLRDADPSHINPWPKDEPLPPRVPEFLKPTEDNDIFFPFAGELRVGGRYQDVYGNTMECVYVNPYASDKRPYLLIAECARIIEDRSAYWYSKDGKTGFIPIVREL
jgi:hypothetical protein